MADQPTSVTVLVGAVAALAGAVAAGLANAYAARQRIREIEVNYLQRLKDGYLENARKMTAEVYIPISVALTSLANSYDRLSGRIDYDTETSPANFRDDFLTECLKYLTTIDDLMKRGADAYLTSALDEELQSFTNFIRDSMDAQQVNRKRVMKALVTTQGLRYLFFGLPLPYFRYQYELAERAVGRLRLPAFDVSLFGFQLAYSERIYAAKVESRDFEARIRGAVPALKALIKEVTLGAPASG
jgi:hypothetical protein